MGILQMSFSASILILIIIVIRALAINKLPKKTFLAFWAVALLRLLMPFSFPSPLSVYSIINNHTTLAENMAAAPVTKVFSIPAPIQIQPENISSAPISTPPAALTWWTVIWITGIVLCSLYFVITYVKCCREFVDSTVIQNDFISTWLVEHKIMRSISIKQSSRISAPLTYGIIHPVILVPLNMDWANEKQVQYILAHEYTHIRRFDAVTKLFLTAALCIHWFNPLVWTMYLLSNRDIELSCDEAVIRFFGETIKTAYALTLVSMEETRSVFSPYSNSFSKNAIEERIVAIMKIKKTSLIAIGMGILLLLGVTTVFATSAKSSTNDKPALQNTAVELPKDIAEKYAPLLALRFDGYEKMTVSEYREKVLTITDNAEYMELLEDMSHDTQLQEMRYTNHTASFFFNTLIPIIAEKWEQWEFGGYVEPTDTAGTDGGILEYTMTRIISDAEQLTVGQHEQAIQGMRDGLQNFWQDKSDIELQDEAMMNTAIKGEIERLKSQWETTALQLDTTYFFVPLIINEAKQGEFSNEDNTAEQRGTPGTETDYQSLLTLKTAGYQKLSVADFNMTLLEWTNADYERHERVNIDIGWNDFRVLLTDEEQVFATRTIKFSGEENAASIQRHYTGNPKQDPVLGYSLTKEKHREIWRDLYYQLTYHITDENKLTVGERDRCLGGVIDRISSFWEGTSMEELVVMSEEDVITQLQTIASEYSNDLIKIDFGQIDFESVAESAL